MLLWSVPAMAGAVHAVMPPGQWNASSASACCVCCRGRARIRQHPRPRRVRCARHRPSGMTAGSPVMFASSWESYAPSGMPLLAIGTVAGVPEHDILLVWVVAILLQRGARQALYE
jgi:hypothetical protein